MASLVHKTSAPEQRVVSGSFDSDMPSQKKQKAIVYGAFKAMGDLLNAASVITSQLNAGHRVVLLLFPNPALEEFSRLIDFGPNRENLEVLHLPVSGHFSDFQKFFSRMRRIQPDLVWISPHAPRPASSWRIPLLLWFTKKLFWRRTTLAGVESERLSALFDMAVRVDRRLPTMERERVAFSMLSNDGTTCFQSVNFIDSIRKHRDSPPIYDLLIHPGASASNRTWPYDQFGAVVRLIPPEYRLAVLGLPADIASMRRVLPADRGIEYLTGNLEAAITAIARASVLLVMDSGTAHFAHFLNVPAVALFGPSSPETTISQNGSVVPIYEPKFPCQPCEKKVCYQPEVFCMRAIAPETVADVLCSLLRAHAASRRIGREEVAT